MTLESQYNQFLKHNPDSNFSFNEWKQWHGNQIKQALINMMKEDEELGLYDESREIKIEDIFNDEKRENIKKFIDEIKNPSEPNQALKDAAERLKGKELFKESNDRARKILSEIKSLPIQERSYSEEDMIEFGKFIFKNTLLVNVKGVEGILEQFKKK